LFGVVVVLLLLLLSSIFFLLAFTCMSEVVAQERKKNWLLETRMMTAEMTAVEAKLALDESRRRETQAVKRANILESEIDNLKLELEELKNKFINQCDDNGAITSVIASTNKSIQNSNEEEDVAKDVNVGDILRQLQELRSEVSLEEDATAEQDEGRHTDHLSTVDQLLARQEAVISAVRSTHFDL
jgi:septal ring factor EnvC (AmiA/AmiB activator)